VGCGTCFGAEVAGYKEAHGGGVVVGIAKVLTWLANCVRRILRQLMVATAKEWRVEEAALCRCGRYFGRFDMRVNDLWERATDIRRMPLALIGPDQASAATSMRLPLSDLFSSCAEYSRQIGLCTFDIHGLDRHPIVSFNAQIIIDFLTEDLKLCSMYCSGNKLPLNK
jgi:hypothetical protein